MTFWVAGAVVVDSAIGADSARSAGNQAQDATNAGIGEQQRQYDLARGDFAPYRQAGNWALQQLIGGDVIGPSVASPVAAPAPAPAPAPAYASPSGGNLGGVAAAGYPTDPRIRQLVAAGDTAGLQALTAVEHDPGDFAGNMLASQAALALRSMQAAPAEQRTASIGGGTSAPAAGAGSAGAPGLLNQTFTFTGEDAMKEPGYQFGLDQGQQALDRKIAAMGGRVSGAALKQSTRYANDYASTKYGDAYNRAWQARGDRLNRLAALTGLAQTATANTAGAGSNSANAISQLMQSGGEYAAGSRLATGNIWAGAGNQPAALYGRNRPGAGFTPAAQSGFQGDPDFYGPG